MKIKTLLKSGNAAVGGERDYDTMIGAISTFMVESNKITTAVRHGFSVRSINPAIVPALTQLFTHVHGSIATAGNMPYVVSSSAVGGVKYYPGAGQTVVDIATTTIVDLDLFNSVNWLETDLGGLVRDFLANITTTPVNVDTGSMFSKVPLHTNPDTHVDQTTGGATAKAVVKSLTHGYYLPGQHVYVKNLSGTGGSFFVCKRKTTEKPNVAPPSDPHATNVVYDVSSAPELYQFTHLSHFVNGVSATASENTCLVYKGSGYRLIPTEIDGTAVTGSGLATGENFPDPSKYQRTESVKFLYETLDNWEPVGDNVIFSACKLGTLGSWGGRTYIATGPGLMAPIVPPTPLAEQYLDVDPALSSKHQVALVKPGQDSGAGVVLAESEMTLLPATVSPVADSSSTAKTYFFPGQTSAIRVDGTDDLIPIAGVSKLLAGDYVIEPATGRKCVVLSDIVLTTGTSADAVVDGYLSAMMLSKLAYLETDSGYYGEQGGRLRDLARLANRTDKKEVGYAISPTVNGQVRASVSTTGESAIAYLKHNSVRLVNNDLTEQLCESSTLLKGDSVELKLEILGHDSDSSGLVNLTLAPYDDSELVIDANTGSGSTWTCEASDEVDIAYSKQVAGDGHLHFNVNHRRVWERLRADPTGTTTIWVTVTAGLSTNSYPVNYSFVMGIKFTSNRAEGVFTTTPTTAERVVGKTYYIKGTSLANGLYKWNGTNFVATKPTTIELVGLPECNGELQLFRDVKINDPWDSSKLYSVGANVTLGGIIWSCVYANTGHSPEDDRPYWTAESNTAMNWDKATKWNKTTSYKKDDVVFMPNGKLYSVADKTVDSISPLSTSRFWALGGDLTPGDSDISKVGGTGASPILALSKHAVVIEDVISKLVGGNIHDANIALEASDSKTLAEVSQYIDTKLNPLVNDADISTGTSGLIANASSTAWLAGSGVLLNAVRHHEGIEYKLYNSLLSPVQRDIPPPNLPNHWEVVSSAPGARLLTTDTFVAVVNRLLATPAIASSADIEAVSDLLSQIIGDQVYWKVLPYVVSVPSAWSSTKDYVKYDRVTFDGRYWELVADTSTNNTPGLDGVSQQLAAINANHDSIAELAGDAATLLSTMQDYKPAQANPATDGHDIYQTAGWSFDKLTTTQLESPLTTKGILTLLVDMCKQGMPYLPVSKEVLEMPNATATWKDNLNGERKVIEFDATGFTDAVLRDKHPTLAQVAMLIEQYGNSGETLTKYNLRNNTAMTAVGFTGDDNIPLALSAFLNYFKVLETLSGEAIVNSRLNDGSTYGPAETKDLVDFVQLVSEAQLKIRAHPKVTRNYREVSVYEIENDLPNISLHADGRVQVGTVIQEPWKPGDTVSTTVPVYHYGRYWISPTGAKDTAEPALNIELASRTDVKGEVDTLRDETSVSLLKHTNDIVDLSKDKPTSKLKHEQSTATTTITHGGVSDTFAGGDGNLLKVRKFAGYDYLEFMALLGAKNRVHPAPSDIDYTDALWATLTSQATTASPANNTTMTAGSPMATNATIAKFIAGREEVLKKNGRVTSKVLDLATTDHNYGELYLGLNNGQGTDRRLFLLNESVPAELTVVSATEHFKTVPSLGSRDANTLAVWGTEKSVGNQAFARSELVARDPSGTEWDSTIELYGILRGEAVIISGPFLRYTPTTVTVLETTAPITAAPSWGGFTVKRIIVPPVPTVDADTMTAVGVAEATAIAARSLNVLLPRIEDLEDNNVGVTVQYNNAVDTAKETATITGSVHKTDGTLQALKTLKYSHDLMMNNLSSLGNVTATGSVTWGFSDGRLKDRIGDVSNALDVVNSIDVFEFTPNQFALDNFGSEAGFNEGEVRCGFDAGSVYKILPGLAPIAPFDQDKTGDSISGDDYRTVDYTGFVPYLTKSVQQLSREVTSLKEENATLKESQATLLERLERLEKLMDV